MCLMSMNHVDTLSPTYPHVADPSLRVSQACSAEPTLTTPLSASHQKACVLIVSSKVMWHLFLCYKPTEASHPAVSSTPPFTVSAASSFTVTIAIPHSAANLISHHFALTFLPQHFPQPRSSTNIQHYNIATPPHIIVHTHR
jgi:hypothetical protein